MLKKSNRYLICIDKISCVYRLVRMIRFGIKSRGVKIAAGLKVKFRRLKHKVFGEQLSEFYRAVRVVMRRVGRVRRFVFGGKPCADRV